MIPFARALIGVAAVAVLLVGGAMLLPALTGTTGGPKATPITTPAPNPSASSALGGSFTSPLMGYSVKIGPGWTPEPATMAWVGTTNNEPPVADEITITGTDSSITITSQPIPAGTTYAAWLDTFHQDSIPGLPTGCDGGDPVTWPSVQVGATETGVVEHLCNAEIVFTEVGGRVYSFGLGSKTFDPDQHLGEAEFYDVLKTVTFDPGSAVEAVTLDGTFVSPAYGYSIGSGTGWTMTPASHPWVGFDNVTPTTDDLEPTGTDSTVSIASQPLAAGQTYDAWVAAYHAKLIGDVPAGCDGGDPSTWATTRIGTEIGHYYQLCNATEAVASHAGRIYLFALGNATFDGPHHLQVSQFLQMLSTVTFDDGAAVPTVAP